MARFFAHPTILQNQMTSAHPQKERYAHHPPQLALRPDSESHLRPVVTQGLRLVEDWRGGLLQAHPVDNAHRQAIFRSRVLFRPDLQKAQGVPFHWVYMGFPQIPYLQAEHLSTFLHTKLVHPSTR